MDAIAANYGSASTTPVSSPVKPTTKRQRISPSDSDSDSNFEAGMKKIPRKLAIETFTVESDSNESVHYVEVDSDEKSISDRQVVCF